MAGLVAGVVGSTSEPNAPPVVKAASTNAAPTTAAVTNAPAPAVLNTNAAEQTEAPVQAVAPKRMALPPGADQVAELAQAGVGESVMLEFVKNSTTTYDLNVDEIVYLTDLGIPDSVLAAMLRHGKEFQEQMAPTTAAPAAAAEAAPPSAPGAEAAQAPTHEALSAPSAPAAPTEATPPPAQPEAAPTSAPQYEYTQPPTEVTYNYFYDTLSPYGSWIELPGYGWCWQPTCAVVDPFWRPYWCRGHWAYTDYGWYWASDYSWGWAPFHYGRWHHHHRHRWVWVPGYVWGPAWVTWRHWDTYCGWAPLPPEAGWDFHLGLTYHGAGVAMGFDFGLGLNSFAFVHYRYLNHPRVWHYPLARHEVTKGYGHSIVVNNIAPRHGGVIVNSGIAPERVKAVTRREVPKLTLRDITPGPASPHKPDRYDRETKQLAVYRPKPPADGFAPPSKTVEPAYQPARRLQEARKDAVGAPAPRVVPPSRGPPVTRFPAPTPSRLSEEGKLSVPAARAPSASPAAPPRVTESPRRQVPPAPATSAPARPSAAPPEPSRQQPASQPRYSAPAPAAPQQRPPSPRPAAPSRPKQESYAPPPAESRPAADYTRSEARKIEPVTPNYTPPPKFASSPPVAPSYGPVPAPPMPRSAPAAPAYTPAPAYAPAPSAPPRPSYSPPASSAPRYAAPPPVSSPPAMSPPSRPAPSPSSPSGGSQRSGGGGGGGGARGGRNQAN